MYGNGTSNSMSGTATLPPGFRFHPTDEELIIHYLKQKVSAPCSNPIISIISDINIYHFNPWQLPDKASFGENEWFFFSPRDRKYPNGTRPNRAAAGGYWKATGTDKPIISSVGSQCLGMKKALVFYKGRPPKGVKTDWTMIEYRLLDDHSSISAQRPKGSMRLDDWVLCRVRQKSKSPHQQQTGEINLDRSCSYSGCGYLQGQEMITVLNSSSSSDHHQYQPQIQDEKEQMMAMECFQEEGSPGCSSSSVSNSQTNTTIDSSDYVKDMLKSMERVLSIGALDELLLFASEEPDEKRLKASPSENSSAAHASVFQISSPPQPSSSYSYHHQQPFSEF